MISAFNHIHWIDGKDSNNKYVMEMTFVNGHKSYMKNDSYEQVKDYCKIFSSNTDCVCITVWNPHNQVVETISLTRDAA